MRSCLHSATLVVHIFPIYNKPTDLCPRPQELHSALNFWSVDAKAGKQLVHGCASYGTLNWVADSDTPCTSETLLYSLVQQERLEEIEIVDLCARYLGIGGNLDKNLIPEDAGSSGLDCISP